MTTNPFRRGRGSERVMRGTERLVFRRFGRWSSLLLIAVLLVATGCSTARRRHDPVGVGALLSYRDAETADYFRDVYRTGSLYLDFRPALLVDAIAMDRSYRRRFVEMLRRRFLLPEAEAARLHGEQNDEYQTRVSVLLFVYEGTNRPAQLTRKDAPWRVFLRDDDGALHAPMGIVRIAEDSPTYLFVDKYFIGLDRWSRMYRVDFPKLTKELLGQQIGDHPFELLVTGVKGTVTLTWEAPALFYAPPDSTASAANQGREAHPAAR